MKTGFSFIEIIIVIMIIGVMAAVITPSLFRRPISERDSFISKLNVITQLGSQSAIRADQPRKILIDLLGKKVNLEDLNSQIEKTIDIPKDIEITDVFINNKTVFNLDGKRVSAFFLINSDGLTQEVSIELEDLQVNKKYRLVLNPFTKQFGY